MRLDELKVGSMYTEAKGLTVLVFDVRPEPARPGFLVVEYAVIVGPEPLKRVKISRPKGAKLKWELVT